MACLSQELQMVKFIRGRLEASRTNLAKVAKLIDAVVWLIEPATLCYTPFTVKV
jgi:hypothetical protein